MALDLSRDITFGRYLDLGSPIHRLDPRTKLLAVSALMVAVIVSRSFAGLAVVLLATAIIQIVGRLPLGYTLRGMRLLVRTMLVLFVFQVLFYPATPEQALWHWWILSFSWAGVALGLITLARVVLLYHLTTTLMFTTTLIDLADGVEQLLALLKRLRIPVQELVLTLVVALKFVPLLITELERLIKAQVARGAAFDQGGILTRARTLGVTLVPLFVGALGRAEVLTVALDARCYRGGTGRTKWRVRTFRRADALALALTLLLTVAAIGADQAIR